MIQNNPDRYRRLNTPFDTIEELDDAVKRFFDGVANLREECELPDVHVVVEGSHYTHGPDKYPREERRAVASLYLGDSSNKLPILARMYGAARAEYESLLGDIIAAGRQSAKARMRGSDE
jgi:hypothetical protein